jgi:hypothetical protein
MTHAVWRTLRHPSDDARFALAVVALGSWVFFVYSASRRSVEANWPAPSYVPGVALLAALATTAGIQRWLRRGVALAAFLVAVLYLHALVPILPLRAARDPLARNAGWDGVAARVDDARRLAAGRAWTGAERYQDVSELAYHLPGQPTAFCTCLRGRHNQYELWPGFPQLASPGDALVLLLDERPAGETHEAAVALVPHFARVTRGALAPQLRGADTVSLRRVWTLEGYRGGWPPRAEP